MPVHIKFAGLRRRTLRSYGMALERFLHFVDSEGLEVKTTKQLDHLLGEYLNTMFWDGDSVSAGGHVLSGIKRFYPQLKLKLPTASQYFRNWQRIHRPERAIPVSWSLVKAMSGICLTLGYPSVALMLLVAFTCFLRTSEMLSLQCLHLLVHATRPEVTVIVPFAKTSNGNPQVLQFVDEHLWNLARAVKANKDPADFLWVGSPTNFRNFWRSLLGLLDFALDDYTPYGIRRGGATWFFLETGSMDATLARGRWSAAKTARQYIDDGTLALAKLVWTKIQRKKIRQWSNRANRHLRRLRQVKSCFGVKWDVFASLGPQILFL